MDTWSITVDSVLQDARYALRWFRRELPLTGAIVLTLAFGIGLNTGVFSVLSGMVFRSRVDTDAASFFQVLSTPPGQPNSSPHLFSSSVADLNAFRAANGVASLAAWTVSSGRLEDDANPSLLLLVTCDFFNLYGLDRPKLGRLFAPAECGSGASARVMLLGEQLWRDRFHGDPAIVGRAIRINGSTYSVAGIVPAAFAGRLRGPGIWIPYSMQAPFYADVDLFREDSRPWLTVEGRRLPSHSQNDVANELTALVSKHGLRTLALTNGSIFQDPSNRAIAASISALLFGALGLIVLLACTNVTMLLLSRAVARRYEMSVRLSLGAGRARLLRMAATEGLLLSLLSGGLSAAIATAVPASLRRLIPGMPYYPMHTDWIVFAYLAGVTLLAGCGAAMVPAAESLRTNLSGSLKRGESFLSAGRRRMRLRELLVSAQVAMSLVLVVGAALFARTQYRLFVADSGFDSRQVLVATLATGSAAVPNHQIETRLGSIDGVRAVSFATSLFWSRGEVMPLHLAAGRTETAAVSGVSPNFFQTLGISVVRGAALQSAQPARVIVTEASAQRLWPGLDALHQTFQTDDGSRWEVAGIVRESDLDRRSPAPRVFRVLGAQSASGTVLLRFEGDPAALSPAITAALDSLGAGVRQLPRTVDSDLNEMGSRFRVTAGFALFFGASAFGLAIIGVYGVMAFAVSRRTKEMGIRLALGATRADILREVLRSGLRPVSWGLVVGLPVAALFAYLLERAFQNTPTPFHANDPLAIGPVVLLLIVGAVGAMLKPAMRACSANPASSLRQD